MIRDPFLAAEAKQARLTAWVSLQVSAAALVFFGLFYVLNLAGFGKGARVAGGFGLLAAVVAIACMAQFVYRGSTVWIARLAPQYQAAAQAAIAVAAALVPVLFFGWRATPIGVELVAYVVSNVFLLATTVVYGAAVYYVARRVRPMLPLRAYLIVVAVTFVLALVGGHLGDDNDAWGGSILTRSELTDRGMRLINYVRFIAAGYVGVTLGLLRQGVIRRARRIPTGRDY